MVVRLKWGEQEYKGRLVSADLYMNLQLSRTVEYQGDKKAPIGEVLIRSVTLRTTVFVRASVLTQSDRCNNVLWIAEAATARPNDDDDMTG